MTVEVDNPDYVDSTTAPSQAPGNSSATGGAPANPPNPALPRAGVNTTSRTITQRRPLPSATKRDTINKIRAICAPVAAKLSK